MSTPAGRRARRDATRNRAAILAAARTLFEANGAQVPYEEVAQAAGLSRTSLTRHFPDRADLIAALWEADVERIEEVAASVADDPRGLVVVLDHVLGQQVERVALHPLPDQVSGPQLAPLVERVRRVLGDLLRHARSGGVARADVDVDDVLMAIDMCASTIVHAGALADRQVAWRRARRLVFPGLFATEG